MEALDAGAEVEVSFLLCTAALHGEVEGAEFTELYLLAFQQLFKDTGLQLVGDTQTDVRAIDAVVLTHVLTELLIAHCLGVDYVTIPLAKGRGLWNLVLFYFY